MTEDIIKQLIQNEALILIKEKCNNPTYTISKYHEYLESKYNVTIDYTWTANFHADYRDMIFNRITFDYYCIKRNITKHLL